MATNPIVVSLSSLNGVKGFRIDGIGAYDQSGRSVSSAGDINGDGFDDIIIGAPQTDHNGFDSGSAYVVFGKSSGFGATIALSSLDGTNGFHLEGVAQTDLTGYSVSSAGDVNDDGFDDIIIGAANTDNLVNNGGSSYIVFGKADGFSDTFELSALDGLNGFRLDGHLGAGNSGSSVASAGDINGDGFEDVIVGAPNINSNAPNSGTSYVVFGKASGFTSTFNLLDLDGENGFRINGVASSDFSGQTVSAAGDLNGDGFDDILISTHLADPNGDESGSTYVVFGKASGFVQTLNLSVLDGTNGFRLDGVTTGDQAGIDASSVGDLNADGFDDIIIGAVGADPNSLDGAGSSYVVFGQASGFSSTFDLADLDGSNGFRIDGAGFLNQSGRTVSGAGDVNGDGFADFIIGAPGRPNTTNTLVSGANYVVFGKADGFDAIMDLATLDGTNGFRIDGRQTSSDSFASAVASAGDVNGDGFDDLVMGANSSNFTDTGAGSTYILFGRATDDITRLGTGVADSLFGGDYNDTLNGRGGNDAMDGRAGNDRLIGSVGGDSLTGGKGRDIMTGGTGSDGFLFTTGDSRATATPDRITDFEKGAVGVGDAFDFSATLTTGGSAAAAAATRASINNSTGVATFAIGSGTTLADAVNDIATRFTLSTDSLGEFALFKINNTGEFHIFVSDGVAGVTANDVVVQLTDITTIGSINLTGGDLTILT